MSDPNRFRALNRPVRAASLFLFLVGLVIAGLGIGQWSADSAVRDLRRGVLQQASFLARSIPYEILESASFSPADQNSPPFLRLQRWLEDYRSEISCRGIWVLNLYNDELVFGPVAYTGGISGIPVPGAVLSGASRPLLEIFQSGKADVFDAGEDRRGDFLSAGAPVIDPLNGRVRMVVGIDVEAAQWRRDVAEARLSLLWGLLPPVVVCLGALLLLCFRIPLNIFPRPWGHYPEAIFVALLGATLTVAAAWVAHHSESRLRREAFGLLAQAEVKPVFDALVDVERNLQALARFFASSEFVDRSEFALFTRPLIRWSGIESFAWIRAVPAAVKDQAEMAARSERGKDFFFWQSDARGHKAAVSRRPVYYPVWYAEPVQFNRKFPGYDLGADAAVRGILEASASSGMPAAIETPPAGAQSGQEPILMAAQAVFARQGASRILGFVVVRLRLDEFMIAAHRSGEQGGSVSVVGLQRIETGQRRRFLGSSSASHSALHRARRPEDPPIHPETEALAAVFPLFVFDHAYVLTVYAQPSFMATYPMQAGILTATGGTLFTLLLTVFTAFILRGRVHLEAEVQARTAELELKSLVLDQIQDHVTITDLEGTITYVNQAEIKTLNRSRSALIGQSVTILGDGPEHGATQREILETTLRQGAWRGEVVNVTGDGRRRFLDCRTRVIHGADGVPLALCGISTDITERRQVDTNLRELKDLNESIVQTMNEGVVLTDIDGNLTFINPELAALLGRTPEELVGRSWIQFVSPEYRAAARAADARRAAGEKDRYEIELQRPDGTRIPVLVGGIPRLDQATGRFAGCLGVFTDLSEQKRAEKDRQQLQVQLHQAQKMESVGRLAGGVAHDYNNMLSVIIGYAEMAMEQMKATDPIRSYMLEILQAARHSVDITRQLLGFARKQPINPRVLDLNNTVDGMLKILRRLIGEDIELVWQPSAGLWPVKLDPIQIDQVLANLCVNARDAIKGVGKITIGTENVHLDAIQGPDAVAFEPGDFVLLTVADDGSGMDAQTLDRLFEPFFTTKPFGQGTGLGLATVYGIVRQNNGYVQVSSHPGQGATFFLYLLRQRPEADGVKATPAPPVDLPKGQGETLLIVEDEVSILHVAQQMLERLGYTVLTAASPGEALALAKTHERRIALAMTDVVMPEMNGRELTDQLKKIIPNLKTLFMSGYTAEVIAQRGVLESGTLFIQKPFTLHELAMGVKRALELP